MKTILKKKHLKIQTLKIDRTQVIAVLIIFPTLKIEPKLLEFKDPEIVINNFKRKALFLLDVVTNRTIYFAVDSTDCDHCRSTYAIKCKNRFEATKKTNDIYEWAEGPTYINRITAEDYKEFKSSQRDMALEAFEDGHAHSIHR